MDRRARANLPTPPGWVRPNSGREPEAIEDDSSTSLFLPRRARANLPTASGWLGPNSGREPEAFEDDSSTSLLLPRRARANLPTPSSWVRPNSGREPEAIEDDSGSDQSESSEIQEMRARLEAMELETERLRNIQRHMDSQQMPLLTRAGESFAEGTSPRVFHHRENESTRASSFGSGTLSRPQNNSYLAQLAYQREIAAASSSTQQRFVPSGHVAGDENSFLHYPDIFPARSFAGPSNSRPQNDGLGIPPRNSELARYVEAPVFVPRRDPGNENANDNDQMAISSSSAAPTNELNHYLTFEPSRAITNRPRAIPPTVAMRAQDLGVSLQTTYQGDIDHEFLDNVTAPHYVNCAVFIIHIPAQAELRELTAVIEGKIFSLSVTPPNSDFTGCAASVVFTTRASALAFVTRASLPGIYIHGQRIRVTWDRNIRRPLLPGLAYQSRVLQIKGPASQLDAGEFIRLFGANIRFRLVNMREWMVPGEEKIVELEFCSINGQSRIAMKLFYSYIQGTWMEGLFSIQYAPDPCEPLEPAVLSNMTF